MGSWYSKGASFTSSGSGVSDTMDSTLFVTFYSESGYVGIDQNFSYTSPTLNNFRGVSTVGPGDPGYKYNCLAYAIDIYYDWEWGSLWNGNPEQSQLDTYMADTTRDGTAYPTADFLSVNAKVVYYSDEDWGDGNDGHFAKVKSWDAQGIPTTVYSKWGSLELIYSSGFNPFTVAGGSYGAAKRFYR